MKKYDAILYIDSNINENGDERIITRKPMSGVTHGFTKSYDYDDPKIYANTSYGATLQRNLGNMGDNFSCRVTDFKKWVVVEVEHNNYITGRSASKTFLIVFQHKGDGIVLSTHNKYRTVSGVDQAISYIRSACSSLQNATQSKI